MLLAIVRDLWRDGTTYRLTSGNYTSGNYTHLLYLHAWAFVDRTLSDGEIAALSGANLSGIFSGIPIQVSIANTATNLTLNWTGGKGPFRVHRTGALAPSVWQNATTQSYARTFTETISNGCAFYRVAGN